MRMLGGVEKKRSIRWANEDLAELDVLEKVRLLDRKPCCLQCGSANVEVIRRPDEETLSSERYDIVLGFHHPECGGKIREKDSGGVWLAQHFTKKLYNIDGKLIREKEADLPRA